MPTLHLLKVSLPETVYEAAVDLAAEQGISLEQLACEAIASRAARPAELDLTEAYEQLADDADETNVEIFLEAQTEALLKEYHCTPPAGRHPDGSSSDAAGAGGESLRPRGPAGGGGWPRSLRSVRICGEWVVRRDEPSQ